MTPTRPAPYMVVRDTGTELEVLFIKPHMLQKSPTLIPDLWINVGKLFWREITSRRLNQQYYF